MTLAEAHELAAAIDGRKDYTVLAIGRFLAPEQLTPTSGWGVSIQCHSDRSRIVLWSEQDWHAAAVGQLAKLPPSVEQPNKLSPSVGQLAKLPSAPQPNQDDQMLLF